ncbi:MAG TPA: peptidase [Arthrobacter sp.]
MDKRRTRPAPALAVAAALILASLALEPVLSPAPAPAATGTATDASDLLTALTPPGTPASITAYGPESAQPLGKPAPLTVPSSEYAFMQKAPDGTPVAYDPCRPIHYVTRAANAPAEGAQLIKESIAAVSLATGLVFIDDGATTEAPAARHVSFQPERYGARPAPVLIAWATAAEEPRFTDDPSAPTATGGLSASEAFITKDSVVTYASGQVALNGPGIRRVIDHPDGLNQARGVIEHELGHLVGLDHVPGAQLMGPVLAPGVSSYQPGDLAGLSLLGQGKCHPSFTLPGL